MLVTFRIKVSITAARRAVGEFNRRVAGWDGSGHYNPDQWFKVCAKAHTLTYEGQRHPLQRDGGLQLLLGLCAPGVPSMGWRAREAACRGLEALAYETSDTRLEWFEVRDDLLCREAAEDEAEDEAEAFSASYHQLGGGSPRARRHA